MERMSSKEQEKIFNLYQEMVAADILGDINGDMAQLGEPNTDDYATGDNRIPKVIGKVQTRKGTIKKSKKKNSFLTENRSRSLIVIDIQPEYSGINDGDENPVFPQAIEFCANSTGPILMFVNAEETRLTGDDINSIQMYWEDNGFDDWNRVEIIDKGYGYLRGWMDSGVPDNIIIKAIRHMYQLKINDSREIVEDFDDYEATKKWKELLNYPNLPEDPLIVNWISVKKLKEFENSYMLGGARSYCLREVELIMNAFNIRYKRIDSLIYD